MSCNVDVLRRILLPVLPRLFAYYACDFVALCRLSDFYIFPFFKVGILRMFVVIVQTHLLCSNLDQPFFLA